jgi:ATP/maltotriose-dependent transcriptional regulator MalT
MTRALAIDRPRLVERLRASAVYPIALLIAPAGYGKSIALREYLKTLREPYVRFALRGDNAELLGFLRGLAEALRDGAPHAITALAGAYERNSASPKRAADLALWMHAHLESFSGVIAIDDLHIAEGDPEVAKFLTSLIEHSKDKIRWILASRSTTGLPVATWLAYRDADLPMDERDLRFTLEEVQEAARAVGSAMREDELAELLALTEGWPAAMSFALRTATRSSELRNVSAVTREMIYRLLAEQVYSGLDADERGLLEVAIALPVIEIAVLERAGFDRALPIVERLRERTAFIYEESPGVYQCHDLFRDFLRRQSSLRGKRWQQSVHERAARALEEGEDIEHAIAAYARAGLSADVVRLLERHGFDLLERARGDIVARAIESLDERTRRENAAVLALQGTLQAVAGKFARAESLLRRALSRAGNDRDLVATTTLRLASLIANQGHDVATILTPLALNPDQKAEYRAEALSLNAAKQAIAGDVASATKAALLIEALLPGVESDSTRAKILHHLGIVDRHSGSVQRAFQRLTQSAELAADLHMFSLASRTNAVLSNLALHEEDDVARQLEFAESAVETALKAGDAFALKTALLQKLSGQMRKGAINESRAIEKELARHQTDPLIRRYLALFESVWLAWEGKFSEAYSISAGYWKQMTLDVDSMFCGAQFALFAALDGHREESMRTINDICTALQSLAASGRFDIRSRTISWVFCALAEVANARPTQADRILRRLHVSDEIEKTAVDIAKGMVKAFGNFDPMGCDDVTRLIASLADLGYGDVAGILKAAYLELSRRRYKSARRDILTRAECDVLRMLAAGSVPKEIAAETTRSVHTVRVHIANAIQKLDCRGRMEAIVTARHLGII